MLKPLHLISILIFFTHLMSFSQTIKRKNYLSVSTAIFDVLQEDKPSLEGRIDFRMNNVEWIFKPFVGIMTNTDGAVNLYAGVYKNLAINNFLIFTPSFAPSIYFKHKSKDLHSFLEFRSGIEFTIKFESGFRVGISFYHVSNASLGKLNPGVESLAMTYYFPL